jgi:hypothetical protein
MLAVASSTSSPTEPTIVDCGVTQYPGRRHPEIDSQRTIQQGNRAISCDRARDSEVACEAYLHKARGRKAGTGSVAGTESQSRHHSLTQLHDNLQERPAMPTARGRFRAVVRPRCVRSARRCKVRKMSTNGINHYRSAEGSGRGPFIRNGSVNSVMTRAQTTTQQLAAPGDSLARLGRRLRIRRNADTKA